MLILLILKVVHTLIVKVQSCAKAELLSRPILSTGTSCVLQPKRCDLLDCFL